MEDETDHKIAPAEDVDDALAERYRRLSLLTLDLAEEAGEAARDFSFVDRENKTGRFERRIASMTRAIWAHRVIESLRRRHEQAKERANDVSEHTKEHTQKGGVYTAKAPASDVASQLPAFDEHVLRDNLLIDPPSAAGSIGPVPLSVLDIDSDAENDDLLCNRLFEGDQNKDNHSPGCHSVGSHSLGWKKDGNGAASGSLLDGQASRVGPLPLEKPAAESAHKPLAPKKTPPAKRRDASPSSPQSVQAARAQKTPAIVRTGADTDLSDRPGDQHSSRAPPGLF